MEGFLEWRHRAQWRSDGRELYYLAADKRLMAVPVAIDGPFRAEAPVPLFETDLDPTGLGISGRNQYVTAASGQRFLLNQARPNAEPPRVTVILNWTAGLRQ